MRVLITGSATGLGLAAAHELQSAGHEVVVHVRNRERLDGVSHLLDAGAQVVIGDLSDREQTVQLAEQASQLGRMDAVIHNAGIGVDGGAQIVPVNIVAPYLLTALMQRPDRLVYLSTSMHRGGSAELASVDWTGTHASASYSDSKLMVTALALGLARRWPEVLVNAVDPGWVPTRMGGAQAPDDLVLGHRTQAWLATSDDPAALTSGGYWHHQLRQQPHPAAGDADFQDRLLRALQAATGVRLG